MPTEEKRRWLKTVLDEMKRGTASALSAHVMPALDMLAEDTTWEVRQDVAELLLYVPEDAFPKLAGKLIADSNGYVRRSAERSRDRRRKAEAEAKRASRGVEEVTELYESLTKQVGGEIAEKAIDLGEKRFLLLANAMVHDLLNLATSPKADAQRLLAELSQRDAALAGVAARLFEGMTLIERSVRDAERYAQSLPRERHPEQLDELIRQSADLVTRNLSNHGYDTSQIVLDLSEVTAIRISIVRDPMFQALTNILTNAFDALIDLDGTVRKGRIAIVARIVDGAAWLQVRDTGCGLAPDELARIRAFLPGRKNPNKKRSTGWGLLQAKKNIEEHDGTLAIDSELDVGTTVSITIPMPVE